MILRISECTLLKCTYAICVLTRGLSAHADIDQRADIDQIFCLKGVRNVKRRH